MGLSQIGQYITSAEKDGSTFLDKLTNQYILKPTNTITLGGSGFVFDYLADEKVECTSDITDHYCEDTNTIQDHQAIKPMKITLHGFVGELWQKAPTGLSGLIGQVNNKLAQFETYTGTYSLGVAQKVQGAVNSVQQTADKINNYASNVGNLINMFSGAAAGPTRQAQAYQKLRALMESKTIFDVEAPMSEGFNYTQFKNFMVETLTFIQPEESKYVSDITIVLKEIRFAKTKMSTSSAAARKGRAQPQGSEPQDNGKTGGTPDSQPDDSTPLYGAARNNIPGFNQLPVATQ
jgi:hypothetical protein